jgi:hypothetical protein
MASATGGMPYEDFPTPDLSGYDTVPEHGFVYVPQPEPAPTSEPIPEPIPEPTPEPTKRECHRRWCKRR